jgi:hypothetical protein
MQWIDIINIVFEVVIGAVYIWLFVHVVNQWRARPLKKGPMFWMSLSLLAMIPLAIAAIGVMFWIADKFK